MKRLRGQERQGTSRSQFCKGDDRAEYIESKRLDDEKTEAKYKYMNIANRGNSLSRLDRSEPIVPKEKENTRHPIVNLCEPYIETVFFQYDSFPMTDNEMLWHNDKIGRIVSVTYYLDSSMGDAVTVWLEKIKPNKEKSDILNFPQNGNDYIKGTFNSTILEFKTNCVINNDDIIRLRFDNASANDVTIMAKIDIKYDEQDFYTKR